jgi:HSP20 family protein
MIIVKLRPNPLRSNAYIAESPAYLISGIINWRLTVQPTVWQPPTDVFETEDNICVRVEIAGMRDADFSVSYDEKVLTIHGIRQDVSERKAFHQMEIHYGEFSTDVDIPLPVDIEKIEATYEDGFLKVILPKLT